MVFYQDAHNHIDHKRPITQNAVMKNLIYNGYGGIYLSLLLLTSSHLPSFPNFLFSQIFCLYCHAPALLCVVPLA